MDASVTQLTAQEGYVFLMVQIRKPRFVIETDNKDGEDRMIVDIASGGGSD